MISPYKKPLLRIDLSIQVTFLVLLFGGYGITFLSFYSQYLQDFAILSIYPILALGVLAFLNPAINILHLILGNYSDETHKLRKKLYICCFGVYNYWSNRLFTCFILSRNI